MDDETKGSYVKALLVNIYETQEITQEQYKQLMQAMHADDDIAMSLYYLWLKVLSPIFETDYPLTQRAMKRLKERKEKK